MDAQTVFNIVVFLIVGSSITKSIMSIAGVTKTQVEGGDTAKVVYLVVLITTLLGWVGLLLLLVTAGGFMSTKISQLLGL